MTTHYIVAWTGGYEAPYYQYCATEDMAWDQANAWRHEMGERDTIDVLKVDTEARTVERMVAPS